VSEIIIGIDLGTTNSEVSIVQEGVITVITDESGDKMLPSAVSLDDDGKVLIGKSAYNQFVIYPERTVLSIKRQMGTTKKVKLGDNEYLPEEISAMILKQLKTIAETHLKQSVAKAVITVPAYFSDAQRQATRKAGELAGLEVVRIINEPTAAALSYENQQDQNKKVLVYDLGGGTFDVSVVSMQQNVVEVVASHGNNHLGGDDFDSKIIEHIEKHLKKEKIDISKDKKAQARIKRAAEKAKINLSDNPYAKIEEEYLINHKGKPYHLSLEISRLEYEEMITPYIDETQEAIHTALKSADLKTTDIDEILLVGGSTRTPLISTRLEEEFDCLLHSEIDPDLCVTMGAAIQGAIIAGSKVDTVLVDITPYTFGTSGLGELDGSFYPDVFCPLIKKNTAIPVTKSEVFTTVHEEQDAIEVKVYQGENSDALENIELGNFTVEGLSKVGSGNPIVLTFQLDLNGILQITAKEKTTGLNKSLTIDNAFASHDKAELADAKQRIAKLFNENIEDAELINDTPEDLAATAKTLIERAQASLEKLNDDDKEDVTMLIDSITETLHNKQYDRTSVFIDELNDMLYFCEEETA